MHDEITLPDQDAFTAAIGSDFAVAVHDQADVLTLGEVTALPQHVPGAQRAPFSLIFTGRRTDIVFDQQLLLLRHAGLGELQLMLTPIGREPHGFRYQAVFN